MLRSCWYIRVFGLEAFCKDSGLVWTRRRARKDVCSTWARSYPPRLPKHNRLCGIHKTIPEKSLGLRVEGLGFRVWGLGVWGHFPSAGPSKHGFHAVWDILPSKPRSPKKSSNPETPEPRILRPLRKILNRRTPKPPNPKP